MFIIIECLQMMQLNSLMNLCKEHKMKKAFITIRYNGRKHTYLVNVRYNKDGRAVVAQDVIEGLLDKIGLRRGDTYTIG
jgi:hypothetical protein